MDQVVEFLGNFFELYPGLKKNPFYIIGRSYGGHWSPVLAATLIKNDYKAGKTKINLKGAVVADGLMSTASMNNWADMIYSVGATDLLNKDIQGMADTAMKASALSEDFVSSGFGFLYAES